MTTQHVEFETLAAFVDHALADQEHASVDAHVRACAECRAQVEKLTALNTMMGLDADVEPSAGFDARVFAAIAAEKPSFATRLRTLFKPYVLGPALAATAALAVFVVVQPGGGEPSEDDLFIAQNQEMLADLELLREMQDVEEAGEDFAVIAALTDVEGVE